MNYNKIGVNDKTPLRLQTQKLLDVAIGQSKTKRNNKISHRFFHVNEVAGKI